MSNNKQKVNNSTSVNNGLETALGLADNNAWTNPMTSPAPLWYNASPYLLSLNWVPLANIYKSNGFASLAVDLPVSDAFKDGGFEIKSKTLTPDELTELQEKISDSNDIETIKDCIRWGRLFGGGLVIINTNQKADTPFIHETIHKKEVELIAMDRWQCYPVGATLQLANSFMLQDNLAGQEFNNIIFDKSRVLTFTGKQQPYYIRNQLQGWGASIFEALIPQLNEYLKANSVILELLDEAKIDILKIFGLSDLLLSAEGESAVTRRVDIASKNKNYKSMLTMDTQDDYLQKQLNFGTLDQILEKIFLLICSSLRIPYSRVFGRGSGGFSDGEDMVDNYILMVDSEIRVPITKILKQVIDIRCYQLFGRKIPDLSIKWKPLKVLSAKEEQELETSKINGYMQLSQMGVMTSKQIAEALTEDGIISLSAEEIEKINDDFNPEDFEEKTEDINVNNSIWDRVKNVFKAD